MLSLVAAACGSAQPRATLAGHRSEAPTARLVADTTTGTAIFAPWTITTLAYEGFMSRGVSNTRIADDRDTLSGCVPGFGTCFGRPEPAQQPSEDSGTNTETTGTTEEHVTVGGHPAGWFPPP